MTKVQTMTGPDTLSVLGRKIEIRSMVDWESPDFDRLILYHIHYFDDLCATGASNRADWHIRMMSRWIRENAPGSSPGWEPYPISRRLVNWLKWAQAGGQPSSELIFSMCTQADLLSRSLEYHLLGNHLLANAKALMFAGMMIDCRHSEFWFNLGQELLQKELQHQVLADGAHYELSPMYHAVVLEDLLDIVNLTREECPDFAGYLIKICRRMIGWLQLVSHPDGGISLFGDSALDGAASLKELNEYASRLGIEVAIAKDALTICHASGIGVLESGGIKAIIDGGPVGTRCIPGHAHADSLTFELSIEGIRVIVDTGISTYENCPQRAYERSTEAHNTIVVNHKDSSEMWGAFRVGRRASVIGLSELEVGVGIRATHDGYRRDFGVLHTREWRMIQDGLEVTDRIDGKGRQELQWMLHVHPGISVVQDNPGTFSLSSEDQQVNVAMHCDPGLSYVVKSCPYYARFAEARTGSKIIGKYVGDCPIEFRCRIRKRS